MRCTILEECRINTSPGPDTNRHGGAPRGARPLPGDAGRVRPRPRAGHKRALARLHEHVRHAKPGVFAAPGRLSALRPPLIGWNCFTAWKCDATRVFCRKARTRPESKTSDLS